MAHFPAILLLLPVLSAPSAVADESVKAIWFEQHIQPVLQSRCGTCHGGTKQSAGLNLATMNDLQRGGESGVVVIPEKPEDSLLFQVVRDGHMPPKGHPPLTAAELSLLRRWIESGARASSASASPPEVTETQIQPILLLRCAACHGGRRQEAGLDVRTKASLLRGGKSGPAVVSGNPAASRIVQRIHAEEMPPRRQLVSVSVKPMESTERLALEAWIAKGLPESPDTPDSASSVPDPLVSDEDRQFWSFRAPVAVEPPGERLSSDRRQQVRNPIDEFILAELQPLGLNLSEEADRATLIRRLSFDLTGLPPAPEDVRAFVADTDPRAWERLVDTLLSSTHYGERWARHWLDVAGYADSEGSQNEDRIRGEMWRYRDYVIRAFNADKPWDRFLHEQLAGDELADYQHADVITDEIYDNLVATGFLRTAPDRTFANITNFVPDRLEVIADEMQILGSAVMGLTLHCARCHSHKFDPIPQRDYYRLTAVFKDALDEHDWLGPDARRLTTVTTSERRNWEESEKQISERVEPLREQLKGATSDEAKKALQEQISRIEAERRPEPRIRALWSRGDPSPTWILKRGNYLTPGAEVAPGVPAVLSDGLTPFRVEPPWPGAATTGRRLAFARWLTRPDHPLTARVAVNRLWKHHFGVGLVTTLANFGRTGAPPSHPELLDWLAGEFVRSGWSVHHMHRLMVTSATWRQSSRITASRMSLDPDNRRLSRMPLRRLEAEAIRDAMLSVSGRLDPTPFGPPDDVDVRSDGLVTVKETDRGGRRSIYVLHRRTRLPTILESFDSPQMGPNCSERGVSIVAPQALHLLNNAAVFRLSQHFAERVVREAGPDPEQQIIHAHELALGNAPAAEVLQAARQSLDLLTQYWRAELSKQPTTDAPTSTQAAQKALQNYCHAILNSAAFIYVD